MRGLALIALQVAAVGCAEPASRESLGGVWSWVWRAPDDEEGDTDAVLIEDKGATLELARCGRQLQAVEVWRRDGDEVTPVVGDAPAGVVDPNGMFSPAVEHGDDAYDSGWSACPIDDAGAFHAGTLSLLEGDTALVTHHRDVCASQSVGEVVFVSAVLDGAMTSLRFNRSVRGYGMDVVMRVDAEGIPETRLVAEESVREWSPRHFAGALRVHLPVDDAFRTLVFRMDVDLNPGICSRGDRASILPLGGTG